MELRKSVPGPCDFSCRGSEFLRWQPELWIETSIESFKKIVKSTFDGYLFLLPIGKCQAEDHVLTSVQLLETQLIIIEKQLLLDKTHNGVEMAKSVLDTLNAAGSQGCCDAISIMIQSQQNAGEMLFVIHRRAGRANTVPIAAPYESGNSKSG